jgi:hypothetical protein
MYLICLRSVFLVDNSRPFMLKMYQLAHTKDIKTKLFRVSSSIEVYCISPTANDSIHWWPDVPKRGTNHY